MTRYGCFILPGLGNTRSDRSFCQNRVHDCLFPKDHQYTLTYCICLIFQPAAPKDMALLLFLNQANLTSFRSRCQHMPLLLSYTDYVQALQQHCSAIGLYSSSADCPLYYQFPDAAPKAICHGSASDSHLLPENIGQNHLFLFDVLNITMQLYIVSYACKAEQYYRQKDYACQTRMFLIAV